MTIARAGSRVNGSKEVTVALRFKAAIGMFKHREMIGHEPGVEPAALQGLGEADQVREVEVGVGGGARIAPPGGMDADRAHESAKMQLPRCGHRCRSPNRERSDVTCAPHQTASG